MYTVKFNDDVTLTLVEMVEKYNSIILDNDDDDAEIDADTLYTHICKGIDDDNATAEHQFYNHICTLLNIDRKNAFVELINNPLYIVKKIKADDNGIISITDSKKRFTFVTLEKTYQTWASKDGTKDKSKTVFGALRFYNVMHKFIRNLQTDNINGLECDLNLVHTVRLSDKKIFDIDAKIFNSNSKTKLQEQENILKMFFEFTDDDFKMVKADLLPLKLSAQKLKVNKNKDGLKIDFKINDASILKFTDVFFLAMSDRYHGRTTEYITDCNK